MLILQFLHCSKFQLLFTYIVGIVFDEKINEKPLRNVTLSIRMNSTYVHETDLLKEL